jgi:PAS domain S-box-containing protein
METLLLIHHSRNGAPLADRVAGLVKSAGIEVASCSETECERQLDAMTARAARPTVVLLGPDVQRPLAVARQASRALPSACIVFLAEVDRALELRRAMGREQANGARWTVAGSDDELLAAVREAVRTVPERERPAAASAGDERDEPRAATPEDPSPVEQALWASEEFNRRLIESSRDCIKVLDLDGNLLSINRAGMELLEIEDATPYLNRSWIDWWGEHREAAREAVAAARAGGVGTFQAFCPSMAGTPRWWDVVITPVPDSAGRPERLLSISRDVTELRRSQRELEDFVENATVGLHWVGPDGTILWANQAELDMLGYTRDEFIGRHIAEFHADPPVIEEILRRLTNNEQLCDYEARLRCKDGSIRHAAISSNVYFKDGEFIHTRCFTRDITDRKRAEDALRESRQQYESIVDSVDGIVWECDAQTFQFTFVSPQAERVLGYPVERWLDEPTFWSDHLHPDDREWAVEFCLQQMHVRTNYDFEYRMIAADGRTVWLRDLVTVVVEDGEPVKLRGILVDVTERRQADEKLRLYHEVFVHSNDGIGIIGPDGVYLEQNAVHRELTGYADEEIAGQTPALHLGQETFEKIGSELASTGQWRGEAVSRTKSGTEVPVELSAFAVRDAQGSPTCYVGVKRDISERKRAEQELAETMGELRRQLDFTSTVMSSLAEGLYAVDAEGRVTFVNPAAERMLGWSPGELIGRNMHETIHYLRPDGTPFPVEECPLMDVLRRGETCRAHEDVFIRKDGTMFPVVCTASPIVTGGEVAGAVLAFDDVTERRAAEEALRRSEVRFRELVEQAPVVIQIFAPDGTSLLANAAWEELWHARRADLGGYNVLADPQLQAKGVTPYLRRAFAGEAVAIPPVLYDPAEIGKIGRPRWTEAFAYPVRDEAGRVRDRRITVEQGGGDE